MRTSNEARVIRNVVRPSLIKIIGWFYLLLSQGSISVTTNLIERISDQMKQVSTSELLCHIAMCAFELILPFLIRSTPFFYLRFVMPALEFWKLRSQKSGCYEIEQDMKCWLNSTS